MIEFLFTATYFNDQFFISKYSILKTSTQMYEVINEFGVVSTILNDITKIAFCERSAILVYINTFNDRIAAEPENERDLLFEQTKIQNAFYRKYHK